MNQFARRIKWRRTLSRVTDLALVLAVQYLEFFIETFTTTNWWEVHGTPAGQSSGWMGFRSNAEVHSCCSMANQQYLDLHAASSWTFASIITEWIGVCNILLEAMLSIKTRFHVYRGGPWQLSV